MYPLWTSDMLHPGLFWLAWHAWLDMLSKMSEILSKIK